MGYTEEFTTKARYGRNLHNKRIWLGRKESDKGVKFDFTKEPDKCKNPIALKEGILPKISW